MRVLNLIGITSKRTVIHAEREEVMKYFIHLSQLPREDGKELSIQELAQLLDFFLDFRKLNNPEKSLGLQSIVTQLYSIQSTMKEEAENR